MPKIASGELRLQAFGVTEPSSGSDATRIRTMAVKRRRQLSGNPRTKGLDVKGPTFGLMLLLARTSPREDQEKRHHGLSVFFVDMREVAGAGLTIRPIRTMINHAATEVFFDDFKIPADSLIEEGKGFRYILDGMNAERILISAECVGDARWFIERAADYARNREVFDRPIGQNQGIQFPMARAYAQTEAAALMLKRRRIYSTLESPAVLRQIWPRC